MKKSQQLLFLQGLLTSIKSGHKQQNKPFTINCKEKYFNIPVIITVYPNAVNCLPFKINDGLWSSWADNEHIENTFRMLSLV
jgi:hypothetical protein